MKTIELKVDDSRLEAFLTIIRNLKSGMVRDILIKDTDNASCAKGIATPWIEEVSDEENAYYVDKFKNMSEEDRSISSKEHVTL
jgi:hypothetical protein